MDTDRPVWGAPEKNEGHEFLQWFAGRLDGCKVIEVTYQTDADNWSTEPVITSAKGQYRKGISRPGLMQIIELLIERGFRIASTLRTEVDRVPGDRGGERTVVTWLLLVRE